MTGRRTLMTAGILLGVGAALLAGMPFHVRIDESIEVRVSCRPPVISAWHRGPRGEVAVWARTVGTEALGYEVRGGEKPFCASEARLRVLGAAGLIIVAGVVFVGGVRTRRDAAT